jgi:multimeric flavodoxin WrbA
MLKILVLTSSFRKKGNTAGVAMLLQEALAAAAGPEEVTTEIVYLADENLMMCRGCRACFDQGEGKCPCQDSLPAIREKVAAADCLVLASPVYVEDVNGVMKNWIDRMAFVCHRPEFFGKSAYLITTSGVGSTRHSLRTMDRALRTWGFHISGQRTFKLGPWTDSKKIRALYEKEIAEMASTIIGDWRRKKALNPSFLALMTFRIQQMYYLKNEKPDTFDFRYWNSRGWLDRSCRYYVPIKARPVRFFLAATLGHAVAALVLK